MNNISGSFNIDANAANKKVNPYVNNNDITSDLMTAADKESVLLSN